jgi:hypothetical protein
MILVDGCPVQKGSVEMRHLAEDAACRALTRAVQSAFILGASLLAPAMAGRCETATPIPLTGWNQDIVFEAAASSSITQYFQQDYFMTFVETGPVTGVNCTGLPTSRTLVSPVQPAFIPSGTVFEIPPYDGNNAAWIRGIGSVTLTLTNPRAYRHVTFLNTTSSYHHNWSWVTITLHFTDHAPVSLLWRDDIGVPTGRTFFSPEWGLDVGSAPMALLSNVVTHPDHTASAADPVALYGTSFGIYENAITLEPYLGGAVPQAEHLEDYTLSAITIDRPGADSTLFFACLAVSGIPTNPDPAPPHITSEPLSSWYVGTEYTYTICASGTPAPTYAATGLPAWLNLSGSVISGTPPAVGATGTIAVTATNAEGEDTQTFQIALTEGDASLIGHWSFDDQANPGKDESIFRNHGVLGAGTTWTAAGKVGGAAQFTGSSCLTVQDSTSLSPTGDMTAAA